MRPPAALLCRLAPLGDVGLFAGWPRVRVGRGAARPAAPAVEVLEDRTLLTSYIVDTLSDVVAEDGKVSLREAIQASNTDAQVNEAKAGTAIDGIALSTALAGQTIKLAGTQLVVTGRLLIRGHSERPLTISGNGASRVFSIAAGADVSFELLTITGGSVTAARTDGGGILNAGTLSLFDCTVAGNVATNGNGGGIASTVDSSLNISGSTVSGNFGGGAEAAGDVDSTPCRRRRAADIVLVEE